MKKIYFYMMIVAVLITACNMDDNTEIESIEQEIGQIKMTTKQSFVSINIQGTGTAFINWGDNSQIDTIVLKDDYANLYLNTFYSHAYYDYPTEHTITITGMNIIRFVGDYQGISQLNVSKNPKLKNLYCQYNEISSLDLRSNDALETLAINHNNLEHLDISENTKLYYLDCSNNRLTELYLKDNNALRIIFCNSNQLTTVAFHRLFESLNNTNGSYLYIRNNPGFLDCERRIAEDKGWNVADNGIITMTVEHQEVSLSLAGSGPMRIDWGDNSEIETYTLRATDEGGLLSYHHEYADASPHTIIIYSAYITHFSNDNTGCTMLDISKLIDLRVLSCANNRLKELPLNDQVQLTTLLCNNNELSGLYLNIVSLTTLSCYENNLTELDLSHNTHLRSLDCSKNKLQEIDVSKNEALYSFNCFANQLTKLDVSSNSILVLLDCEYNKLTSEALNALFGTLRNINTQSDYGRIYICDNPGVDSCDKSIAEMKRWNVF